MKKTLYEVLGVDKKAQQSLIETAYKIMLEHHNKLYHQGDMDAHSEMVIAKEAYAIISNNEKRAAYDKQLEKDSAIQNTTYSNNMPYHEENHSVFMSWWETSKTSMVLTGILLLVAAYIGIGYFNTSVNSKLIEKTIGKQDVISNNVIDIKKQEEELKRTALENRQKNEMLQLEMARREQDARLDRLRNDQNYRTELLERQKNEQEKKRELELSRQKEDNNQRRIAREQQYYSCLNPAINRYGLERAQTMCSGYR